MIEELQERINEGICVILSSKKEKWRFLENEAFTNSLVLLKDTCACFLYCIVKWSLSVFDEADDNEKYLTSASRIMEVDSEIEWETRLCTYSNRNKEVRRW